MDGKTALAILTAGFQQAIMIIEDQLNSGEQARAELEKLKDTNTEPKE